MATPNAFCGWNVKRRTAAFCFLMVLAGIGCDSTTEPTALPPAVPPPPRPALSQPAEIVRISGDNQRGTPGSLLEPIIVGVRDAAGKPLPGVTVAFSVAETDGITDIDSYVTDDGGKISVRWWLGRAGPNSLVATVENQPKPLHVTFSAMSVFDDYPGATFQLASAGQKISLQVELFEGPTYCSIQSGSLLLQPDGAFIERRKFDCGTSLTVVESGFYGLSSSGFRLLYTGRYEVPDVGLGGVSSRQVDVPLDQDIVVLHSFGLDWSYRKVR